MLSHGGSCIIGPLGTFLAEPVWDEEGIVYAELRMDELTEAKMEYVYFPESMFHLLFETRLEIFLPGLYSSKHR